MQQGSELGMGIPLIVFWDFQEERHYNKIHRAHIWQIGVA